MIITLKHMTISAQALRIRKNSEKRIALAFGFVGQLGLWWDNMLTHEQREEIFSSLIEKGRDEMTFMVKMQLHFNLYYTTSFRRKWSSDCSKNV